MGVSTAIIAVGLAIWTAVGREQRGSHFENAVAGVSGKIIPFVEVGFCSLY